MPLRGWVRVKHPNPKVSASNYTYRMAGSNQVVRYVLNLVIKPAHPKTTYTLALGKQFWGDDGFVHTAPMAAPAEREWSGEVVPNPIPDGELFIPASVVEGLEWAESVIFGANELLLLYTEECTP